MARKFGEYEDNEEYVRRCVVESLQPCRLSAASIANMCTCLAYAYFGPNGRSKTVEVEGAFRGKWKGSYGDVALPFRHMWHALR